MGIDETVGSFSWGGMGGVNAAGSEGGVVTVTGGVNSTTSSGGAAASSCVGKIIDFALDLDLLLPLTG